MYNVTCTLFTIDLSRNDPPLTSSCHLLHPEIGNRRGKPSGTKLDLQTERRAVDLAHQAPIVIS